MLTVGQRLRNSRKFLSSFAAVGTFCDVAKKKETWKRGVSNEELFLQLPAGGRGGKTSNVHISLRYILFSVSRSDDTNFSTVDDSDSNYRRQILAKYFVLRIVGR